MKRKKDDAPRGAAARVYLIGNAHIDPVWLWRWPEGLAETKATFRSALDRMRETPDYVFTASSAALYAWVEANEPHMFREIQERVEQGRWGLVGGWWIEPDVNIPAGESLTRQGLLAQRYFRERFGRMCAVGYCVDSFGHPGTLPKILAGCRLHGYVFMRPQVHENAQIPLLAFRWQADDKTEVTALRIPQSYTARSPQQLEEKILHNVELASRTVLGDRTFAFYGVGNHGGGPTQALLRRIAERQREDAGLHLQHASVDEVVAYAAGRRLPRWRGEMQHHARGCYAAVSALKQANRQAEAALLGAEMWAVAAWLDNGRQPDRELIQRAWKDVLFNQFHDILAGSSVAEACTDALRQFDGAIHAARTEANAARQSLSWRIDTRGEGLPLVVFNEQPVPFHGVVETEDVGFLTQEEGRFGFTDARGRPVPCQEVTPHTICGRRRFVVQVDIPSLGFVVLHQKTEAPGAGLQALGPTAVRTRTRRRPGHRTGGGRTRPREAEGTALVMENEFLRVGLTQEGYLTLDDRPGRRRILRGGALPVVVNDSSDTWSHGVDSFRDLAGRFTFQGAELQERGPVRGRLRARYQWRDSQLTLEFLLGADERHVEIRGRVDWRERWQMLKLVFPVPYTAQEWTAEVPFGTAVRPTSGEEEPVQRWVDLSTRGRGLAVVNDGRYSCSAEPGQLRVTILRSPPYAFHDPFRPQDFAHQEFTDQGVQRFTLALLPHGGDWRRAGVIELARRVNGPPHTLSETFHPGDLPPEAGFVSCRGRGVYVEALKPAEEEDAIILRAAEWFGSARTAHFELPGAGQEWSARFRAHEVKTFRIPLAHARGQVMEVDMLETESPRTGRQRGARREKKP